MSVNLASLSKTGWRMLANLVSPTNFPKRPFWRVLKFDKFAVEWPLLSFTSKIKTERDIELIERKTG
jgi:hypothetical protein